MGNENDTLLAISTSGNSTNVLYALDVARAKGLKTIALTGRSGGKIASEHRADITIRVPEDVSSEYSNEPTFSASPPALSSVCRYAAEKLSLASPSIIQ